MGIAGVYCRARIVVRHSDQEQNEMISYYAPTAPPGGTLNASYAVSLVSQVNTNVAAALQACIANVTNYDGVALVMSDGTSIFTANLYSGGAAGTEVSDVLPVYVAALLTKFSSGPGRSGRGRWFVPCVPETFTNGDALTNGAVVAYNALATQMVAPLNVGADVWQAIHYSRHLNTTFPIFTAGAEIRTVRQGRRYLRPLL